MNNKNEIILEFLKNTVNEDTIKINEPLSKHSTFKIGGEAKILVMPNTIDEIRKIILYLKNLEVKYLTIGYGSNILFSDEGFDGVILKLTNIKSINVNDNIVSSSSGASLGMVQLKALQHSLTGLEFSYGIPATVGGSVYMNAGAYEGEVGDVILSTKFLENDEIKEFENSEHKFGYRTSIFKYNKNIILETKFKLKYGNYDEIRVKMDDYRIRRAKRQPKDPSAGSVFKRPKGVYVGPLIEKAGLKGYRIGGALVSEKHCGFIVNSGGATSSDVKNLISHIQEVIYREFSVELIPEIEIF